MLMNRFSPKTAELLGKGGGGGGEKKNGGDPQVTNQRTRKRGGPVGCTVQGVTIKGKLKPGVPSKSGETHGQLRMGESRGVTTHGPGSGPTPLAQERKSFKVWGKAGMNAINARGAVRMRLFQRNSAKPGGFAKVPALGKKEG